MNEDNKYKEISLELRSAVKTIKTAILQSQARAARMISGSQLSLYFGVGLYVSANSREGTWGTGAIDAISEQLHRELPGLRGFSAQNIRNMRQFAEFWQPFLFHSPTASKIDIKELSSEIEYDRFALAKWSPMASPTRTHALALCFVEVPTKLMQSMPFVTTINPWECQPTRRFPTCLQQCAIPSPMLKK